MASVLVRMWNEYGEVAVGALRVLSGFCYDAALSTSAPTPRASRSPGHRPDNVRRSRPFVSPPRVLTADRDRRLCRRSRRSADLATHELACFRAVVTASARDAVNSQLLRVGRRRAFLSRPSAGRSPPRSSRSTPRWVAAARSSSISVAASASEVNHDEVRRPRSRSARCASSSRSSPDGQVTDQDKLITDYPTGSSRRARTLRRRRYDIVAGTGGNFDTVARLCPVPGREIGHDPRAGARALASKQLTPVERQAAYDLRGPSRRGIVPALYDRAPRRPRADRGVTPGVGSGRHRGRLIDALPHWDYSIDEVTMARAAVHPGGATLDEPTRRRWTASCACSSTVSPRSMGSDRPTGVLRVSLSFTTSVTSSAPAHHKHCSTSRTPTMGLSVEQRMVVAWPATTAARYRPPTRPLQAADPGRRNRVRSHRPAHRPRAPQQSAHPRGGGGR